MEKEKVSAVFGGFERKYFEITRTRNLHSCERRSQFNFIKPGHITKQAPSGLIMSSQTSVTRTIVCASTVQQHSKSAMEESSQSLLDKIRGSAIKTLFVVGTAALVLDSVRNSLTWYLGKLWGDVGITWQQMWIGIMDRVSKHMSL